MEPFTFEELVAIKVALEFVIDDKLQLDLENYDRARRKVDAALKEVKNIGLKPTFTLMREEGRKNNHEQHSTI